MAIGFVQREHCPLCGSKSQQMLSDFAFDEAPLAPFLAGFYAGRLTPAELASGRYRIRCCKECGFIFQDNILDDAGMHRLYQDWVDQASSLQKKRTAKAKRFLQYAGQVKTLTRLFDKPPQQTRVLDYGMGWGYWCRMVQAHGFDARGYELSASRREHARQLGVSVMDKLEQTDVEFDFIYANQEFEYLPIHNRHYMNCAAICMLTALFTCECRTAAMWPSACVRAAGHLASMRFIRSSTSTVSRAQH